ncbi:MAG: hypothetical protein PF636_07980, partial [Actinomycetota bacterium]|nr:hypothetical protein [Actinomycetota bacterium]
ILWEFLDILEKRTVYLDNEFKYLDDFEWRSAHPGWPFTIITWDDVPDSVWPVGLGKAIEPPMLAINGLRAREYSAAGTGIRKYLTSDNLSMDAKDALMSTEDGTIVEVTQAQFNQVKQLAPASYPPQWDALEERMRRGIDETTHTTEYDTGSAPEIRRTATESAYIQNSSDAMTAFRQQQVERMVSDIGEKILAIVLSVWDKPIPIQIQNRDPLLMINDVYGPREAEIGELIEFDFVGIDHAGLYSVSTEPGSLVAQAKELERSQAMQMYDKFLANPRFASDKFMSFVMSTFPSIQNPQDFILSDDEVAEEAQKAAEAQAQSAPQRAPQAPSGMGPETPGELAASELGAIAPGVG